MNHRQDKIVFHQLPDKKITTEEKSINKTLEIFQVNLPSKC